MLFVNLHRHDTFSLYDGFGTAKQAAAYAKELGQTALALTNHGNVCGLIEHWAACNDAGIKPILGVEAYFQPEFKPEQDARRYHLTLWCQTTEGYHNLMRMLSVANREQFYRVPVIDWRLLETYADGLAGATGCILGYVPRLILDGKDEKAERALVRFQAAFDGRFYAEVQPFEAEGQKRVNEGLFRLTRGTDIEPLMTLDSHYTRPEEFSTYRVMHRLAKRESTGQGYRGRHLMSGDEVLERWRSMHPTLKTYGQKAIYNTEVLAERCAVNLAFKEMIPRIDFGTITNEEYLRQTVQDFLADHCADMTPKERGRYEKRAKRELAVIFEKGFQDYFLLCHYLVKWAKDRGIATSFGRGSVCGSLVAMALGLTRVDPLILGTYFERFLRPDKNVMPDVDLDFDAERRGEVVEHALQMFEGKSAPISNFGYWRAKNLWNALAKLYEVDRQDAASVKLYLEVMAAGDQAGAFADIDYGQIREDEYLYGIDRKYKGILRHFCRLYGQVTQLGRHAAGIAITADSIDRYLTLTHIRGELQTSYDMDSLARVGVVKIDILGLATASIIRACEERTGMTFSYEILKYHRVRNRILKAFRDGETEGIFQFEKGGAKKILAQVKPETFEELAACNALNRPGPIIQDFVDAKNGKADYTGAPWYEYLRDTYGVIVYQEQVMRLCRAVGMEWGDADKVMKSVNAKAMDTGLRDKFVAGAVKTWPISKQDAARLYRQMTLYLFNKGHACGYTLIGYYLMYFKLYHPLEFWWATLRYEKDDYKRKVYEAAACRAGVVLFPPHVNGSAQTSIEEFDGEHVIRLGLDTIKGIGTKAALMIELARPFKDDPDFHTRVPKRYSGKGVTAALDNVQALEFDQRDFLARAVKMNAQLAQMRLEVR